jgi:hypothetical protein
MFFPYFELGPKYPAEALCRLKIIYNLNPI